MDLRCRSNGEWVVFHDPLPKGMNGSILKLPEALTFCRRRRLEVYLDVKDPRGESSLARLVRSSRWLGHTTLLAGGLGTLHRWRKIFPHQPLFWVTGFREPITPRKIVEAGRLCLTGFVSYRRWVTRASVERAHRAGLQVFVWTVRTVAGLKRFARIGVDGIMSEVWPPPRSI